MEINYIVLLGCGVLAMVLGFLWYGPLFGKQWMKLNDVDPLDTEKCKEMAKSAGPLYGIQFVLVLLQLYILSHFIQGWSVAPGMETAVWIWLGFIMPTIAGSSMWSTGSGKTKWMMFFIQAGYQFVCLLAFGYILGRWG